MSAMSTISKTVATGWAVSAALCIRAVGAPDATGARPGDDAMTCEQIGTELAPYAQQMQPNLQAQQYQLGRYKYEERKKENETLVPLATAAALDPTGASKRAYQAAVTTQAAKEKREDEADAISLLAKQATDQRGQFAVKGPTDASQRAAATLDGARSAERLQQEVGQRQRCCRVVAANA